MIQLLVCDLLSVLFHINYHHHHHHITSIVVSNRGKSKQPNAGKVLRVECILESLGGLRLVKNAGYQAYAQQFRLSMMGEGGTRNLYFCGTSQVTLV